MLKRKHADGEDENLTVKKATYANPDKSAVIVDTVEAGQIIVNENDELWEQLVAEKITVEAMPAPSYDEERLAAGIDARDGEQLDAMSKQRQKQKLLVGQARAAAAKGDLAGALGFALEALEPTDELNALDGWRMGIKQEFPKPKK